MKKYFAVICPNSGYVQFSNQADSEEEAFRMFCDEQGLSENSLVGGRQEDWIILEVTQKVNDLVEEIGDCTHWKVRRMVDEVVT